MHKGPRGTEAVESGHVVTVGTLRAHHPGTAGVQSDTDHIVATYPINTQLGLRGPDTSNTSRDGLGIGDETDPAYTLQANHTHAVAFTARDYGADATEDLAPTMRSLAKGADGHQSGSHGLAVAIDAAHAFKVRGGCEGGGKGYLGSDEVAFTISTHQDQHIFSEPAIAWSEELTASVDLAGTIQRGGSGGRHDGVMVPAAAYLEKQKPLDPYLGGEVTIAIDASYSKGCGGTSAAERPVVASNSTVRRLTPVECERLQGFPDNFTAIPWGKKEAADCPDGPRYKALGNSMAVPVMRWIGERINTVDDLISVL